MRFKKLSNKSLGELRDICQPPLSRGVYLSTKLFRKLSIFLTVPFLYLEISPTAITFTRFIIGVFGISLIGFGQYWLTVTGLLIFEFALILDLNDGEVFRYRTWKTGKRESFLEGTFLDNTFDYAYRPLLLIAAGIGSWISTGYVFYMFLGVIGAFLVTTDSIIKLRIFDALVYKQKLEYLKEEKKDIVERSGKLDFFYELFRINNVLTLYFWFGIFGYLHYFLVIYIPLVFLLVIKTFFTQYKRILELDKDIYKKTYRTKNKN